MRYNVADILMGWTNATVNGEISKAIGLALENGYLIYNIYIQYSDDFDSCNGPVFDGFTIDYTTAGDIELLGDYAEYTIHLRRINKNEYNKS